MFMSVKLLPSACLAFVVYKTIMQLLKRRKFRHIPGPKTRGILEFYLGNFNDVVKYVRLGKPLPDLFFEWSKIYGPTFKYQLFGEIIVVTIEPTAIKEILINENFPKNPLLYEKIGFPYRERFMGLGLVTDTDDKRWRSRRSIFNPGFHKTNLLDCLKEFNAKTDILIEKLRKYADDKTPIVMYREINRLTLDIISSVAFGFSLDTINFPDNEFSNNITRSFEAVNKCFSDPIFVWNPFAQKKKDEFKNVFRNLRKFAREKILNRIGEIERGEHVPNDILTIIINSCKQDQVDLEALIDDFITFFNAGQETTANTLAFVFLELGRNPSAMQRLKEEIDREMGARVVVDYEDMNKLEYTNCVFKEALRLWPPAPIISRVTTHEFSIGDFRIPKNTQLTISPYVSGHSELYFNDAEQFRPERFLKENQSNDDLKVKNYTYYPFSMGQRNCIGQNFAVIESIVLIVKLVQNFDFRLDENQSFGATLLTTLRPTDGAICYLTARK